ncbi:GNAT family N-acetyltransferase [Staphylospora marina]|uniref:GNAT family N-acetyltransferase n=1 Tax=Staphylospora marina TaxID=2490858 RepID=UPI000F5BB797|nr:GNAT family N-acetyltransferase [Staphylospora marina]
MDKHPWLLQFHKELRQEARMEGFVREETEHVVRLISRYGDLAFIIASDLNEENAGEVIRNELDYFRSLKQDFEWKVYSYDRPPHLKELLRREGFTVGEPEALMIIKLDERHPLLTRELSSRVREITDEQGIRDIVALEDAVWGESHAGLGERLWRDKREHPDSLYLYGVFEEDRLVSAAWMYLEQNSSFASLWGGATLPEFRGKGGYSDLLAIRARKAYEKGHPFLMVDASPMSRPILEKHGFVCLAYSYGCQSPSMK